jgi:hypothetical protein
MNAYPITLGARVEAYLAHRRHAGYELRIDGQQSATARSAGGS